MGTSVLHMPYYNPVVLARPLSDFSSLRQPRA
jgi:hypothetical protein